MRSLEQQHFFNRRANDGIEHSVNENLASHEQVGLHSRGVIEASRPLFPDSSDV